MQSVCRIPKSRERRSSPSDFYSRAKNEHSKESRKSRPDLVVTLAAISVLRFAESSGEKPKLWYHHDYESNSDVRGSLDRESERPEKFCDGRS